MLAVLLALAGCGSTDDGAGGSPSPSQTSAVSSATGTTEFLPGLEATVVLPPDTTGEVPLVVLVPGGGWKMVDTTGFPELADDLAARGAAVVTIAYRTAEDQAYFPVPVEDVACGLAYAVQAVGDLEVSEVVLVGHSTGAHMAALVALDPEAFTDSDCPYDAVTPDALVGISGPYDVTQASRTATYNFFAADQRDPATWDDANPLTYAGQRPDVPVLLLHGTSDEVVPITQSEDFEAALIAGGHDVTTDYVEGATHWTVYAPDVAGTAIAEWLGVGAPDATATE